MESYISVKNIKPIPQLSVSSVLLLKMLLGCTQHFAIYQLVLSEVKLAAMVIK